LQIKELVVDSEKGMYINSNRYFKIHPAKIYIALMIKDTGITY